MERQQAKKKFYIPLTLKLALVVISSLVAAVILYEALEGLENVVAQKYYLNEDAETRNINAAFRDFKEYIEAENLKTTDTDKLQKWIRENDIR